MNNTIEIYQNNTFTLGCYVTGGLNLTGFAPYLTVKKKASDTTSVLSKLGTVTDPSTTVTFDLTTTDTSLAIGSYVYDIVIEKAPQVYTIVKDSFIVRDGVRY